MSDSDPPEQEDRELGVEFGDLRNDLQNHEYPASGEELVDEYGDREVSVKDDTETFENMIGVFEDESFDSADEVVQAILNMVSEDAIGRKNYSDRTPYAVGEDRQEEGSSDDGVGNGQESF